MFELIALGIAGATGVYGHIKSRNFVGKRLRYTKFVEKPALGLFAGVGATVVAAPLVGIVGLVPLVGGLLSNRDAYRYLPRSVDYLPETSDLLTRLAAPGFQQVQRWLLGGGAAQLLTATRSRP